MFTNWLINMKQFHVELFLFKLCKDCDTSTQVPREFQSSSIPYNQLLFLYFSQFSWFKYKTFQEPVSFATAGDPLQLQAIIAS